MRYIALGLLMCSLLGCGSTPKRDDYAESITGTYKINADAPLQVQFFNNALCDFRVNYSSNNTVSPDHMMYDGSAGVAGLLAQIAVHAAIKKSAREAKLAENQEGANRYLRPINDVLKTISHKDLVPNDEKFHFAIADTENTIARQPQNDVLVSHPIFFFSEDLKSLTLKHVVKVQDKGAKTPKYQNMIEVISKTDATDAKAYWLNTDEQNLLQHIRGLYKDSLLIVHKELAGQLASDVKQKNHRITVNEKSRFERGSAVLQTCNQTVIRNLRGWLIAFPSETTSECQA